MAHEERIYGFMNEANTFLLSFLILYIGQNVFKILVDRINIAHMKSCSGKVPGGFSDVLDESKLATTTLYTVQQTRLEIVKEIAEDGVLLLILLSGFLPLLEVLFNRWGLSLVPAGLLFFLVPGLIQFLVELPFSYYHTFGIEQKFGFNQSTLRLWILDLIKTGTISLLFFAAVFSALLLIIAYAPRYWWLWGFLIVSLFQVLLSVLYPVVIAPLFNKFEPIRDEALSRSIQSLMAGNGIRVKKILQMDAGARSRHTNAYFTGIGKTKQIVLFDTLLASHSHEEILAVLAHEAGHFRKRHVLKLLAIFEVFLLAVFYLTSLLIKWPPLYAAFGFASPIAYAGLFLAGILWQKAGFFLQPVYMAISRYFEKEADIFTVNMLQSARPMMTALKRLAADNLSNLNPHPFYVRFHYSHPPIVERVSVLEEAGRRFDAAGPDRHERMGNRS